MLGSIAAAIQSSVYGAYTTGVFSALQSFGATAVIASHVALALGGISLAVGAGLIGFWWWKKRKPGQNYSAEHGPDSNDDNDDKKCKKSKNSTSCSENLESAVVKRVSEKPSVWEFRIIMLN